MISLDAQELLVSSHDDIHDRWLLVAAINCLREQMKENPDRMVQEYGSMLNKSIKVVNDKALKDKI